MSIAFNAANQARLAIKMKCSNFSWYIGSSVEIAADEYIVVVNVLRTDEAQKIVPTVLNGVEIKTHHSK